eukprot:scaffold158282_cov21-Tisochrysis_lutea.AAC.1
MGSTQLTNSRHANACISLQKSYRNGERCKGKSMHSGRAGSCPRNPSLLILRAHTESISSMRAQVVGSVVQGALQGASHQGSCSCGTDACMGSELCRNLFCKMHHIHITS